jgi:hypothetical protein
MIKEPDKALSHLLAGPSSPVSLREPTILIPARESLPTRTLSMIRPGGMTASKVLVNFARMLSPAVFAIFDLDVVSPAFRLLHAWSQQR